MSAADTSGAHTPRADTAGGDTASADPTSAGTTRIAGTSTAWWGTVLLLLVLSSMLSTLLFAHPYLAAGSGGWGPADVPPLGLAVAAAGVAVASTLPAVAMHRSAARDRARAAAAWALATGAAGVVLISLGLGDLAASGVAATDDAHGSARVVTVVFHLAVAAVAAVALLLLPLRLWAGSLDRRQRDATVCAALLWYYVVGGWLCTSAVIHLVPVLSS